MSSSPSRNDSVDSEYLAAYIERCAESEAPLHLTKRERLFIADAILIAAEKSAHSETQPIPHWTCGCGHVNGCNLEWCAMCYRRPNGSHKDE